MSPRARTAVALCLLLAVAGGLGVWAWLPFDPFEGPAGRLDGLVPADVDAAFRCDGAALLSAPFVVALQGREDLADLRDRLGIGEAVTAPLRRIEAAFSQQAEAVGATPTLARDLVPAEVVVAVRGDEVLVLSRISSRARAIELVRREDPESLAALGLRIDGAYVALLDADGSARLWAVRHRDVLLVGSSREIVSQALTLAETGGGGLARRPGFDDALALGGALDTSPWELRDARSSARLRAGGPPCGERVLVWATPQAVRRWTEPFGDAPWRSVLAESGAPGPVRVVADLSDRARFRAEIALSWRGGDLPATVAAFAGASESGASPASRGAWLAGREGAVLAGGLRVRAADVLEVLLRSSPPELEDAAAEAFAEAGVTPATVASALAAHLEDGAAIAVVRLPESDRLASGEGEPGAVRAIPGTLVAFRLRRGAAGADALEEEIHRNASAILGEPLAEEVWSFSPQVRLHTLPRRGLAGHWALLRPAFAFAEDWFVVASNAPHLRGVLAGDAPGDGPAHSGVALRMDVAALRRLVEDRRWEEADRATWHDWPAERREIEAAAKRLSSLRPADRADYVDARMRERASRRLRDEIPRAAEEWRRQWDWLGAFSGASVEGDVSPSGAGDDRVTEARLRVEVVLSE